MGNYLEQTLIKI